MVNFLKVSLNNEQKKAVKFRKGPLLVIAGAGTGKTTVITERIKFLIEKDLAKPSEVLALTFTEKAANEMQERVDISLPYGYTQMWISTFHSFCDRILRSEVLHIGLDPRYKLMTDAETIQLIRKHLFEFDLNYFRPLGNPNKFISGMIQHFSRLQDEDINPNDYADWVTTKYKRLNTKSKSEDKLESEKFMELVGAYRKYEELKVKEGLMDFGDLIIKTISLFRERENVLQQYRKQFKYILVDEFQDTNYAQNELLKLLTGKEGNITVVADDDQSIYRFRGAAVSNVVQFRKSFPKAEIVVLSRNYRSLQNILDKSYQLIQSNNPDRLEVVEKIGKKLIAQRKNGEGEIVFIHKDRVENEADSVAKELRRLVTDEKYDYKDFAILVRANNHSEPFIRALSRNGIPYQFLGPGKLFRQPEIIDLISYLKVLYDFDDSVSFYKVLTIPYFDVNPRDLVRVANFAKRLNLTLFEACEKISEILVSNDTKEKIIKIVSLVNKHIMLLRKETAGQILYYFLQDSGLLQKLLHPDSPDAEKKASNISKLFDKLKTYEVDHEDASVTAVVDWIELSSELGESPLAADSDWSKVNAVNILTIHSAKGLEFPIVFLVNLVSQRFPTIERREQIPIPEEIIKEVLPKGDFHIQEERRLFYVGMTRAKDKLYFTAADYYGDGKREKKLSPFIFEALGEGTVGSEQAENSEQLSFLDYKPPQIFPNPESRNRTVGFHIDYLSYSQIEAFKTCPLHFKLKYIFRIPTPPSAAQSFGTTIHAALKNFYVLVSKGEKPSNELLYKLLEDSWIKEGYTSKKHEEKFFEKGKLYLSGFLKQGFVSAQNPVSLEQKFILPVNGEISEKPLKIGGVMDRVDVLANDSLEIIDYKTGATIPSQKEVDNNLQLTFYALAASTLKEPPFNKDPKDIKLSLYFLDQQEKLTTQRTKSQLSQAIREIFDIREQIENSEFKCSGNMLCEKCEYSLLCRQAN